MDIQPAEKTKLILILIFSIISLVLAIYLVGQDSARQPTAVTEHSHRGSEATESARPSLTIEGYEALEERLPNIADTVPNQILQHHYDNTKQLERHAKLEGDVKRNGDSYSMRILFPASNTPYTVTIRVVNDKTGDYKLNVVEDR